MAADLAEIVRNLTAFYGFAGRTVVAVGAGGGQLIEYARQARRVIAVDPDGDAVERLATRVRERGLADRFTIIQDDLLAVRPRGEVVLFEFCLHQMADPERSLEHARELAPDALVIDHAPGSQWSWSAAEDEQVDAAWEAVARRPTRREFDVEAFQRFPDYAGLEARMSGQGPESRERIGCYRGQEAIAIPMPYRLALL